MHLDEGIFVSYLDRMLDPAEQVKIDRHLSGCPACRTRLEEAAARAREVDRRLTDLTPAAGQIPDLVSAQTRFRLKQQDDKERTNMWDQVFSRRVRPAWGVALVVLVFAVAFAFPSVRAIANNFLGLFRVEQIAVVEINPANLPDQLGSSATFEQLLAQNVNFEEFGEPKQVGSAKAASAETGLSVRLPDMAGSEPEIWVHYGSQVTFEVELARLRALLKEIGRTDVNLPDGLDGTTATLTVQPSVVAAYGACGIGEPAGEAHGPRVDAPGECTTLAQVPSPTISAPDGLNLPEIGRAFLQVMGMTEAEAARFSDTVDWTTTLVVPIPQQYVEYVDVRVDGVEGVLFQEDLSSYRPNYMVLWVKDGVIYSLTGSGDGKDGVALANSLR